MTKIDEYRQAAEAATGGPLFAKENEISGHWRVCTKKGFIVARLYDTRRDEYNTRFFALACTAVPALCDALEREKYHRAAVGNRIAALMELFDSQPYKVPKNVSVMIAEAAADLMLLDKETEARIDKILEEK